MTMTKIETITLGSAQASLVFSSIPSTSTDLMLLISARSATSALNDYIKIKFNASTTGYSSRWLYGTGSSASSYAGIADYAGDINAGTSTSDTFSNNSIYIPNYAGATAKSWSADGVLENNATAVYMGIDAGLWTGTDAISTITLATGTGANFTTGTTATLYGILKGSGGATVS